MSSMTKTAGLNIFAITGETLFTRLGLLYIRKQATIGTPASAKKGDI